MKNIYSSNFNVLCTVFLLLTFLGVQDVNAQFWKNKKKETTTTKKKPLKKKEKSIKQRFYILLSNC